MGSSSFLGECVERFTISVCRVKVSRIMKGSHSSHNHSSAPPLCSLVLKHTHRPGPMAPPAALTCPDHWAHSCAALDTLHKCCFSLKLTQVFFPQCPLMAVLVPHYRAYHTSVSLPNKAKFLEDLDGTALPLWP